MDAAKKPLLHDIVLLKDSVATFRADVDRVDQWPVEKLGQRIDVLLDEITEILERHDILEWMSSGDRDADRRWQRPVQTIASADPDADGRVGALIRPGYTLREGMFRPQDVVIVKYQPPDQTPQDQKGE